MDSSLSSLAALAAEASIVRPDTASALVAAANLLLPDLERGRAVDAQALRAAMVAAFGGSDAEGAWTWKTAYEACEAAHLRHCAHGRIVRGFDACYPAPSLFDTYHQRPPRSRFRSTQARQEDFGSPADRTAGGIMGSP
jgi:hypothetical protein